MEIELDEDMVQVDGCESPTNDFNSIIGHIEDIVISDKFQEVQTEFLEKNCMLFTNEEENKIYYMDIFNQYTKLIEEFILDSLNNIAPDIDMDSFLSELRTTATQFDGEIYEFLFSLSDFQTFKSLMLDFKEYKLNRSNFSALDECFKITKL
ncbi:ADP-ribosylation factor-like protein 2-binding protein [Sitodiplosis mosellana]|uniref:ADP-ribosylation factor-like protein 2-binding protein n=1 Tax=Sitodiplosis mosellana TaxID=263140 RepID=UPI002444CE0D|nr:ADP-ribosylation factor-like protein 2-binding protein [Sitodiplosis mosellana]